MFQFHKVQFKVKKKLKSISKHQWFQFHKVQFKVFISITHNLIILVSIP